MVHSKVFRPSDGFANKCSVCAALLRVYLNMKKDVECFVCGREFRAPQVSGNTTPKQVDEEETPDETPPAPPRKIIIMCANSWCNYKVRIDNGDMSVFKKHQVECERQWKLGMRYRLADGVESYVPQLEYGLDTEVMQRESSLVIPQAEQEDEDHADNLSESSRDESDDEKEA